MGTVMDMTKAHGVNDRRVLSELSIATPDELKLKRPLSIQVKKFIAESRQSIKNILDGKDHRLFVVVGPCSIHDPVAAIEYAHKLKRLSDRLGDTLFLVMRVYFEKPRTSIGWKGLINDPDLNGSFKVNRGLDTARKLLIDIADIGLPVATESLDPITPQYLHDLISWTAIGARTTESQTHREMASGLSSAVGFKNGTDGSLEVAVNAIKSSAHAHRFLGVNGDGKVSVIKTTGNSDSHIVLRGGGGKPNYSAEHVTLCESAFIQQGIKPRIMIDCSHVNSMRDHNQQEKIISDVINQIINGNESIKALMIESNLHPGSQVLGDDNTDLLYGVSITDKCIGWNLTETSLEAAYRNLKDALQKRRIAC